jgi:hypothetical protein
LPIACPLSAPDEEIVMPWLRYLAVFAIVSGSFLLPAAPAQAEYKCNVPAGYYRLVDLENAGVVAFREQATHRSHLLGALNAGDIVESEGTRSTGDNISWQKVRVWQTVGWIPAQNLWRALPVTLEKTEFPAAGWCGNFEPLWSMNWSGAKMRLAFFPGRYESNLESVQPGSSAGEALLTGKTPDISYRIVYTGDVCRSDDGEMRGLGRAYVILTRDGQEKLYSGCCSAAQSSFPKRRVPGQGQ